MVTGVIVAGRDLQPSIELVAPVAFQLAFHVIAGAVAALGHIAAFRGAGEVGVEAAGLVGVVAAQSETEVVVDRTRRRFLDEILVETVIARAGLGLEIVGRPLGDVVDGAAVGVAAVEGALRSAQHLDLIDEQGVVLQDRRAVGAVIDAVEIDRDARLDGKVVGVAADAANVRPVVEGGVGQARRVVGQILDRRDAPQFARLSGEGRDGDRHPFQQLRSFFGGDDDLAHRAGFSRRGGRGGGGRGLSQSLRRQNICCEYNGHGRCAAEQPTLHGIPPCFGLRPICRRGWVHQEV